MRKVVGLIFFSWRIFAQDLDQLDDANAESSNYYAIQKLDLNESSIQDFENLLLLTPIQLQELIDFRNRRRFSSNFEIQTLPSWDIATCRKIHPYLRPVEAISNRKWSNDFKLIVRSNRTLEEKKGFSPPTPKSKTRYLGDPWGHYLRFQAGKDRGPQMGLILQKDPGESNYLDFLSAHLGIQFKGFRIIFGDFTNQWSQGLILSGGFFLGKSYQSIVSTQKIIQSARPYTSSGESNFNRGIFLEKLIGDFRIQLNLLKNPLDATIIQLDDMSYFSTLYTDGYHRTSSEYNRKHSVELKGLGLSLNYIKPKFQLDFNLLYQEFNPGKIRSEKPYQANNWYGNRLWNYSIGYTFHPHSIRWVGEWAMGNQALATSHGLILPFSKKVNGSLLVRYYSSGFYAIQSNGFRENTTTSNELGVYLGQEIIFSKRKKLWLYEDIFLFPELKYQVSQKNSFGWEMLGRMQWNKTNFSQLKYQSKQEDGLFSNLIRQHHFQLLEDFYFEKRFRYKIHARFQYTAILYQTSINHGLSLLVDQQTKWKGLKMILREWLFFTGDYDSRIYSYEPGLQYNFSIPAVYDKGFRGILVLEQKINQQVKIGLKIARLNYFFKETIGSSYEEIQGKHRTDVIFQLIYAN